MITNPNDSVNVFSYQAESAPEGFSVERGGLTKREYFAAMAMQGLSQRMPELGGNTHAEWMAKASCEIADALINELNK